MANENEELNGTELVDEFIQNLGQEPEQATEDDKGTESDEDNIEADDDDKGIDTENVKASEQHVPLSEVASLREDRRTLRAERDHLVSQQAELKGRLDALTEMVAQQRSVQPENKPEELSPLEQFEKDYPDESPDASTLLAERKWQEDKAVKRVENENLSRQAQIMSEAVRAARLELSDERIGAGLGLDSVVGLARQSNLITEADQVYASQFGQNAPKVLYKIAVEKIQGAGGAPLKELSARVAARKKSAFPLNNKNKPTSEADPSGQAAENEGEYSNDVMAFMFS